MTVKIVKSKAHTSLERIKEFETLVGQMLPEEYREFLLHHNGGRPEPSGFKFSLNGHEWNTAMIAWFLALYDGEYENISNFFNTYQDRIPQGMIAIARDPGGSLILLGLEDDRKGEVFFWLQELEGDDGEPASYDNVALVANSFNEFLHSFVEIE